ncbi:hypothetical protein Q2941_33615 [Bradyrhizobium sp. UFLA05-153]
MQHKNETFSGGGTITCRLEMASQNVRFADPVIREEAVGCLGIRPILADERNALSANSLLPIDPLMSAPSSTPPLANQVLSKESQVILSTQDFADQRISPGGQSYG